MIRATAINTKWIHNDMILKIKCYHKKTNKRPSSKLQPTNKALSSKMVLAMMVSGNAFIYSFVWSLPLPVLLVGIFCMWYNELHGFPNIGGEYCPIFSLDSFLTCLGFHPLGISSQLSRKALYQILLIKTQTLIPVLGLCCVNEISNVIRKTKATVGCA